MPRKPTRTEIEKISASIRREHFKKCPRCSAIQGKPVLYPATTEYFYTNKSRRDKLSGNCRMCDRDLKDVNRPSSQSRVVTMKMYRASDTPDKPLSDLHNVRRCAVPFCRRVRPATTEYFPTDHNDPSGLSTKCRLCHAAEQECKVEAKVLKIQKEAAHEDEHKQLLEMYKGLPGCDENGFPY